MPGFFQDLDARMRKAVQENPTLNSSLTSKKGRRKRSRRQIQHVIAERCCLACFLLAPVAIVVGVLLVLRTYNDWVRLEEAQLHHIQQQAPALLQPQAVGITTVIANQPRLRNPEGMPIKEQKQHEPSTLVLTTEHGTIRIQLLPELSRGSVEYIRQLIAKGSCDRCNLYRAEKPGILQGIMKHATVATNNVKGDCPKGAESIPNDCPKWDEHCGCHGPLMTKGAVAWAAGGAGGPDFFIDNYEKPAMHWGTQHTNFGRVEDDISFQVIDTIFSLPVNERGGMHLLQKPIHFDLSLE